MSQEPYRVYRHYESQLHQICKKVIEAGFVEDVSSFRTMWSMAMHQTVLRFDSKIPDDILQYFAEIGIFGFYFENEQFPGQDPTKAYASQMNMMLGRAEEEGVLNSAKGLATFYEKIRDDLTNSNLEFRQYYIESVLWNELWPEKVFPGISPLGITRPEPIEIEEEAPSKSWVNLKACRSAPKKIEKVEKFATDENVKPDSI